MSSPATAQSVTQAYIVRDVHVDVTSTTAARARDIALNRAQRAGLNILLERLTSSEGRDRLPFLDDAGVSALVASIEFENERYSTTRYISDISLTFSRPALHQLFQLADLPFSETMALPILVLPISRLYGAPILWNEDQNPWLAAWRRADLRASLIPLIVPVGDPADRAIISGEQAIGGYPELLSTLIDKYGASTALFVLARQGVDPTTGDVFYEFSLSRSDSPDAEIGQTRSVYPEEGETIDSVMDRAVHVVVGPMIEDWKRMTQVSPGTKITLLAQFAANSLKEWVNLRDRLSNAPLIERVSLDSINVKEVVIKLDVLGSADQLAEALILYGVELLKSGDRWELAIN